MTDQLVLTLTPRQQAIVDAAREYPDGISADDAGRAAHSVPGPRGGRPHSPDETCEYCGREGSRLLRQLVALGVVRRRRAAGHYAYVLTAAYAPPPEQPSGMLADDEEIPF